MTQRQWDPQLSNLALIKSEKAEFQTVIGRRRSNDML